MEGVLKKEDWVAADSHRLLQTYLKYDDQSIVEEISRGSTGVAKQLIDDVRNRRLLKTAYELPLTDKAVPNYPTMSGLANLDQAGATKIESEIADKFGIQKELVIVHVQSSKIKLYENFDRTRPEGENPILVKLADGNSDLMENLSPFHADRGQIRQMFIFAPKANKEQVRDYATERWGPSYRRL